MKYCEVDWRERYDAVNESGSTEHTRQSHVMDEAGRRVDRNNRKGFGCSFAPSDTRAPTRRTPFSMWGYGWIEDERNEKEDVEAKERKRKMEKLRRNTPLYDYWGFA